PLARSPSSSSPFKEEITEDQLYLGRTSSTPPSSSLSKEFSSFEEPLGPSSSSAAGFIDKDPKKRRKSLEPGSSLSIRPRSMMFAQGTTGIPSGHATLGPSSMRGVNMHPFSGSGNPGVAPGSPPTGFASKRLGTFIRDPKRLSTPVAL